MHIQTKHEEIKPVESMCNQCSYKTSRKGALKQHIESAHEGIRYSCNQCEKEFTTMGNLRRHIKIMH